MGHRVLFGLDTYAERDLTDAIYIEMKHQNMTLTELAGIWGVNIKTARTKINDPQKMSMKDVQIVKNALHMKDEPFLRVINKKTSNKGGKIA